MFFLHKIFNFHVSTNNLLRVFCALYSNIHPFRSRRGTLFNNNVDVLFENVKRYYGEIFSYHIYILSWVNFVYLVVLLLVFLQAKKEQKGKAFWLRKRERANLVNFHLENLQCLPIRVETLSEF